MHLLSFIFGYDCHINSRKAIISGCNVQVYAKYLNDLKQLQGTRKACKSHYFIKEIFSYV